MKTLEQVAADYGLTPDGVAFALEQYQKVICEITHNRMSKLSYYADDILSVANDVRCDGCEYVEPYILAINEVASWVEKRRVDREPIWIETKDGICACIVSEECWDINIQADLSADLYGKTWRCWNIKPSDEQRKNTPWKE